MSSSQSEDMDAKRLASIAADAVSSVLFFHTKHITPPADIRRAGLEHAVNAVFHLRSRATDIAVAHLEIACDAALAYAHEYNELNPDNTVHPRWMYICVQALLSHRLKPALMQVGKTERLLDWVAQQKVQPHSSDSELDEGPTLSPVEVFTSPSRSSGPEFNVVDDDDDDDNDDDDEALSVRFVKAKTRTGIIVKEVKTPWGDTDIRRMIELRAQGLTHLDTAARLGRGKGAVENKYGRVVKETAWKPYVAQCQARYTKFRLANKRKVPSVRDDEEDEENDSYDEVEDQSRPVAKKRKMTLAAAAGFE